MQPRDERDKSVRRYSVFISYRHADNVAQGRQWATWLHQALESYEVPSEMVGNVTADEQVVPETLYPVFRDEDELPAGASLTDPLREALENSGTLVVICSPRAVQSRFVADEIRYFKELGKAHRVLCMLIDGEPNASDDAGKAGLGITPDQECLPEPLRFGVRTPDNRIDWTQRAEPIAADTRPEGGPVQGWTSGVLYRQELAATRKFLKAEIAQKVGDYEKRLELAKLKIIAGALGVPLGELTARDEAMRLEKARQRTQVRRRWLTAVGALAFLAIVGGTMAWNQHKVALLKKQEAMRRASDTDYAAAQEKLQKGDLPGALTFLGSSLRNNPSNFEAASRLLALGRTLNHPVSVMQTHGMFTHAAFSPDSKSVLLLDDKQVRICDALTGKDLVPPLRHDGGIPWASFSPDGKRVVTASQDKTARVWDAKTGKPVGEKIQHAAPVWYTEFSPDSKRVATTSEDKTARVWDAETGTPVSPPLKHAAMVAYAVFSPDGKRVVTDSVDGKARVWDVESGNPVGEPIPNGSELALRPVFSPDGKWLLTAAGDASDRNNAAHVTDVETGQPVGKPMPHPNQITFIAFSPDGTWVLTGCSDKSARVWDIKSGKLIGSVLRHQGSVFGSAFSPDQLWVVTASADKTAQVWETLSGRAIGAKLPHDGRVYSAAFSPDGKWILTASDEHKVRVWPLPSVPATVDPMFNPGWIFYARFSPDGRRLVTSLEKGIEMWNAATGQRIGDHFHTAFDAPKTEFSPDSKWILVITGKAVSRLDTATMQPAGKLMEHEGEIYSAHFSPDGRQVITASADNTVRFWDAATGEARGEPLPGNAPFGSAEFSPDAKWIVTQTTNSVQLWDAASRKSAGEIPIGENKFRRFTFTPDSKRLWALAGGRLQNWNVPGLKAAGETVLKATDSSDGNLSPDGSRILINKGGGTLGIWDATTGNTVGEPIQHKDRLRGKEFSPDGNYIVTSSMDKTAALWNGWTGKHVATFTRLRAAVSSASFSPDGKKIVVTASDHTAQIWDFDIVSQAAPPWMADFAEAMAGARLNAKHAVEPIDADLPQLRARLSALTGDDDYSRFGRWYFADHSTRTITASSQVPVPEYVADLVKENTIQSLAKAYMIAPGDPLVVVSLARFDADRNREMFYCRHAVERARQEGPPERAAQVIAVAQKLFPAEPEFQ